MILRIAFLSYFQTVAADFALGANPHFSGNEYFFVCLDDFASYARGMSAEEIWKGGYVFLMEGYYLTGILSGRI